MFEIKISAIVGAVYVKPSTRWLPFVQSAAEMGNLLRVLNDKGSTPKVDFFVDFESK